MAKHERFIARDALAFIEERIHKINNLYAFINDKEASTKYKDSYITTLRAEISQLMREIIKMARWYHETERGGAAQQPYGESSDEVKEVKREPEEETRPAIPV